MVHLIGNAHIDPVWLWRWREGYAEVKATFRSALDRMEEDPGFIFTAACADYYRWVKENDPDMFREIKKRAEEGRWRAVGGMWVQPDCNMPSGESFARHLLYSLRFFRRELGVNVRTGYNVDSFGHCAALPALLKKAGIDNYVFMRPGAHENGRIPGPLFKWEAPDGSRVTAFRIISGAGYTSGGDEVKESIARAMEEGDRAGVPVMCFYGVGNHGGGPTRRNIASIRAFMRDDPRGNEAVFSDPDAYFEDAGRCAERLPVWRGEMQHHASGCYSLNSRVKALHRRAENALVRCEEFLALSAGLTGHEGGSLEQAWRDLLFCEFHDVLCGCCIREAYEDAYAQLYEAVSAADREENAALQKISWRIDTVRGAKGRVRSKESHFALWESGGLGTPVVVFNPHPFEAEGPVQVFGRIARAQDAEGRELPVQDVRAGRTNGKDKWDGLFTARVPALGYALFWVYPAAGAREPGGTGELPRPAESARAGERSLENGRISVTLDARTGMPSSIVRKDTGKECLKGPARAKVFDIEDADSWAHGIFRFDRQCGEFEGASFLVLEDGPVRARVRAKARYGECCLTHDYLLYADSDQLEVRTSLDMREGFRMVKLCFPVADKDPAFRAETAFCSVERPLDGLEETCHRWIDAGGSETGLGILNDGRYSCSASNGEIALTIANTSLYADHFGQEERDETCEHADMGVTELRWALVPRGACLKEAGLPRRADLFSRPMPFVTETYHEGDLPGAYEGLRVEPENVSVSALKRAEDGGGWVLRAWETAGEACRARVFAPLFQRDLGLAFSPFEIKTVYIPSDPAQAAREVAIDEEEARG